ncbi:MAG: cyclic nucleotide-binding domain-containing protein [Solirubrobacterales bacterium]|nr:cyclic nucleotide-binding domain-containing protein [Solirubrobacterales bacterium]
MHISPLSAQDRPGATPSQAPPPPSQRLFDSLDERAREALCAQLRPRVLPAGAVLCRAGDRSDSLYLVERGLLHVLDGDTAALLGRQQAGDVVGEVALLTGEPRSATLLARVPSAVSELSREAFLALAARHPALLANLASIVCRRLVATNRRLVARTARPTPARITALLTGSAGWAGAATAVATARATSAAPLAVLDAAGVGAGPPHETAVAAGGIAAGHIPTPELLARLDAAAAAGPVLLHVRTDHANLAELLDYCDRTIAVLPADGAFDPALAALLPSEVNRVEPTVDPARLGRRLARASVGVAFGAGGAKGWAHVGALRSLRRAGYVVDAVAGSSIGAWFAAWTALGHGADTVGQLLRESFDTGAVQAMFRRGGAEGAAVMERLAQGATADARFAELGMPLTVMTADLAAQRPVSLTEGGVADALVSATTVPGLYPPVRRGEQRLVDAVVLTPVPTAALAGVDVTVAVNPLGRQALPEWPGAAEPERAARDRDPVVESLELASFGAAAAQTAAASVPVTPRFGPGTWRDFRHADRYLAAGEEAMDQALSGLRALAHPGS